MPKLIPALAVGAAAVALAFAPTLSASAAPSHAAAKHAKTYTLAVDGNGKHATVAWLSLKLKDLSTGSGSGLPDVHTVAKAKEPWRKHIKPGADLIEVVAVQTTGSRLSCTIKNTHGTVVAHSTSRGKNTIVTCIVAKDSLGAAGLGGLGGLGGGTGSTGGGSGSSVTGSLVLPIR